MLIEFKMKQLFYIIPVALLFGACKDDTTQAEGLNEMDVEVIELRNQVEQLRLENRMKDSVLNESIAFFNEIQENLAKISVKQDQIRLRSDNPELTNDDKEWVLQEIQNINFLREENARKVRNLQGKVKDQTLKITELQAMIDRLVLQIKSQDERIEALQNQLADLDMEYSELFDQYQEQVELALDVMKELNTAFYAYGTMEELINNEVLVKEGGFIGIGKKTAIAENLNQKYFQKIDKTKTKQLTIVGNKPQLVTDHPSSSYEWNGNKLIIKDAERFWRVSKYLVITVK
jgi:archaellum component FlaC